MLTDVDDDGFGWRTDQRTVGVINDHSVLSTRCQVADDVTSCVFLRKQKG